MNTKSFVVSAFLAMTTLVVGACSVSTPAEESEQVGEAEQAVQGQFCGGIAGIACADGHACVDDPTDSCDPDNGGADCGGVCKKAKKKKHNPGCNDPARDYVSTDPAVCALVKFACADGLAPFSDECGCGCEPQAGEACGQNVCGAGTYCCNSSCGLCAPDGGFCIQIACIDG